MKAQCLASLVTPLLLLVRQVSSSNFEEYILAPSDRRVSPASLIGSNGNVSNAEALVAGTGTGVVTMTGINSTITLDFERNIAGTVQFQVDAVSGQDEYLGATFTESSMWISPSVCDSASSATYDSPLWFRIGSAFR